MDVVGVYALHYGLDYIRQSVRSVYPFVTKLVVLYTPRPSYGYKTNHICPDTEGRLRQAVESEDAEHKVTWITGAWPSEGTHRAALWNHIKPQDTEMVITVDGDEIWPHALLPNAISHVRRTSAQTYRIGMYHFWRSFNWVCVDNHGSIRITCPSRSTGCIMLPGRVYHFGYARSLEDMEYRMAIHGHKSELRAEWYGRFLNWPRGGNDDLHPVVRGLWKAEPFDKTVLPEYMHAHPYYGKEIIT